MGQGARRILRASRSQICGSLRTGEGSSTSASCRKVVKNPAGLSEFDQCSMLWPFAVCRIPARRPTRPGFLNPGPLGEDPSLTE
uniref:FI16874p1 n=1 Tax=Drosophila melanogaster TaxID=7227 RepID=A8JUZ4_DROME